MALYDPNHFVRADSRPDVSQLAGKSVIITGGASGLGEAFARRFVAAGAFVTIGDLSEERGKQVVSELGGEEKAAFVRCNVTNWDDQLNLFKAAITKSPSKRIDIVCANAGISGQDEVFLDQVDSEGDPVEPNLRILNTNLIGVMYTARLSLHYLPRQPEGQDRCLIVTASMSGYLDQPGSPQYNTSKWGVRGLMRSLRRTVPTKAMRINLIAPWFIRTDIMSQQVQDILTANNIQFATKEDAATAVLHLASDTSLNGRALAILPRDEDPHGYRDLRMDDYRGEEWLADIQDRVVSTKFRVGTK